MADVASHPHPVASPVPSESSLRGIAPPPPPSTVPGSKKAKAKKAANDPNEATRQLQARIAQLEQDKAGKTEEDAEIGV